MNKHAKNLLLLTTLLILLVSLSQVSATGSDNQTITSQDTSLASDLSSNLESSSDNIITDNKISSDTKSKKSSKQMETKKKVNANKTIKVDNNDFKDQNTNDEANDNTNSDNDIYVSPTATTNQTGTQNNPTTLPDAVSKIQNNKTIILTTGTYNINSTIFINENTTKATKFNITGLDNVVFTGNTTIFNITNADVTLNNCNFTNNTIIVNGTTIVYAYGGAIYNAYSNLTINNCNFTNNSLYANGTRYAYAFGGAIYNLYSNVTITDSSFIGNEVNSTIDSSLYKQGGAIYNSYSNMTINNSIFNENANSAIYNNYAPNVTITNTSFTLNYNNDRHDGGAIKAEKSNLTVTNSKFINNTATFSGGAISVEYSNLTAANDTFINNTAPREGGAIQSRFSNTTIHNTIITNSSSNSGGAVYSYYYNLIATNNTFTNNIGNIDGGAIEVESCNVNINNNTYNNNAAVRYGGAVHITFSNTTITNNIYANNSAKSGGSIYVYSNAKSEEMIIKDSFFINSTADNGGAIYFNYGNVTIENNQFINVTNETVAFKTANNTMINNSYTNCNIGLNITITLSQSTQIPVHVNDTINLIIDTKVSHPEYYDENLKMDDIVYDVYMNDVCIKQTEPNANNFTITPNVSDDVAIYIYANKNYLNSTSNIIVLDVLLGNLQNTVINAPSIIGYYKESATLTVTVTNKTGTLVADGGTVEIYDENNNLLGQNNTVDGVATIHTTPINKIGLNTIILKYNTTDGIYNNQTNTTTIMSLTSDVYVSPDVTAAQEGTNTNPTTIEDALTKIRNDGTIHLLYGTNGIYKLNNTILINNNTIQKEVQSLNFAAQTPTTLDGNNAIQILNINKQVNASFTNITFANGNSTNGGAIYSIGNLTFKGKTQFINNTAITSNKNTNTSGGAIYTTENIESYGQIRFDNNQANSNGSQSNSYGGAIFSTGNITLNGMNIFNNNQANGIWIGCGGAIYDDSQTSRTTLNGTNIFTNNYARGESTDSCGGAIYASGAIILQEENTFENNTANGYGGSIFYVMRRATESNIVKITGHSTFTNNLVTIQQEGSANGGAIYIYGGNITITNTSFINNTLNGTYGSGAAVFCGSANLTIYNCTFINNNATLYGAIYTGGNYLRIIKDSLFINNTMNRGVIYISGRDCTVINNTFINTNSSNIIRSTNYTDINNKIYNNQTAFKLHRENNTLYIKLNITNYSNKYPESTQGILNVYNGNELLYTNTSYTSGTDTLMSMESLEQGTYQLTITFTSEDNNLINITTIQNVTTKMRTVFVIENEDTKINKTTTINFTLQDANGTALPDKTINLQIGNITTSLQTNTTGQAQYEYTSQKANTNTIIATFDGDTDYINTTQASTITVNKIGTTVTLSNITTSIGKNTTLTAKIVDENGNLVNGGRVAFKVNGITIKDSEGNTIYAQVVNGTAQITTSFNLRNKYYTLSVVYSGNSVYDSLRANSTLTLTRKECTIVLDSPATATIGEEITLKLTITDDDAVINSGKAVFKLNGLTLRDTNGNVIYTKVVNNTATLKYTLPTKLKAKTYNITAVYGSSSTYNRTETTNQITLNKSIKTTSNIRSIELVTGERYAYAGNRNVTTKINVVS